MTLLCWTHLTVWRRSSAIKTTLSAETTITLLPLNRSQNDLKRQASKLHRMRTKLRESLLSKNSPSKDGNKQADKVWHASHFFNRNVPHNVHSTYLNPHHIESNHHHLWGAKVGDLPSPVIQSWKSWRPHSFSRLHSDPTNSFLWTTPPVGYHSGQTLEDKYILINCGQFSSSAG